MVTRGPLGVLTFHRCVNQGSYWQARCLVDALHRRGAAVEILDHVSRRVNYAEWRCALQPTLPTPVPVADRPHYRRKLIKFHQAVAGLPLSQPFDLEGRTPPAEYDTVIVGSDEVWNLDHPWYGGVPLFFGEGIRARRLVSYAASFGNFDGDLPIGEVWARRLKSFDALSVRDHHSGAIVADATGREPAVSLDPCLQFPPAVAGRGEGPDHPFLAVYGHNFSQRFAAEVRRWATARRLPVVSVSYRNDWADVQWLDAGPDDFNQAVARSEAVATNFFHGCVFALLHSKPFVCELSSYRQKKVRSLTSCLGAQAHLVSAQTTAAEVDALLEEPLAASVLDAIDTLRTSSQRFLDEALA
jgi:Polysaccharide pyruvyl transferase